MAYNTKSKLKPTTEEEIELKSDFATDLDAHDYYVRDFDAYEAMVASKTFDSVSKQVKSGITDSSAATLTIERAARVVGQLPGGVSRAAGKKDKGKGALMDIVRQKWVYPNANAQFPFLMKLRMWQFYSSVYGYMPMYYDWHVAPNGYIGPDCWIWNPRNFIPQTGFNSVSDMDYVHALSYKNAKYLKSLLDEDDDSGWDKAAIKECLDIAKNASKEEDSDRDTLISRNRNQASVSGQICLVTKYEAGKGGKWITFLPDFGYKVLRSIKNPHKSSKIPFVVKYSLPLFDSFYGLGDFQRMRPIQAASDGLDNFYFHGIKRNLYQPTIINPAGVVKHTINLEPGAVWEETVRDSIRTLQTSTAGLSTYQSAKSQMKGALMNLAGTTDTTVNAEKALDPGFGRTPQALKMLQERESTRDNQDRTYLEIAVEELLDGMLGLIPNVATENIPIDIFSEEVKEIVASGNDDVLEMLEVNESEESARLTIKPSGLKGVDYRFNIDPGTTAKQNKEQQKQSLVEFLGVVSKFVNELREQGKGLNVEFVAREFGTLADVPGLENLFIDVAPQAPGGESEEELAQQSPENPEQPPMIQPEVPQQPRELPEQPMEAPQGELAPPSINDPELASTAQELQSLLGG